jgi:hypothetical protein
MATEIPDAVFDFFAADPARPMLTFARETSDPHDDLGEELEAFLSGFSKGDVAAAQASGDFQFFAGHQPDKDRAARVWLGERLLGTEIARRRLDAIRQDVGSSRPRPYAVPALEDLEIGNDRLVPLSAFSFDGARLLRNEFAFSVLPTTGSPNSTYWLLAAIYDQGLADRTRVRLDPFLFGPAATFPAMHYRMWMYGRPLDWGRVEALQEPEHGRWMPDSPLSRGEFTDYAWTPRDAEVHFVCEEIPDAEITSTEAARYLHAVYVRASRSIEHFDGAIRVYAREEIQQRRTLHARKAGKMGLREKVFVVDGPTDPDSLSQVAQAFFVWNSDVQQYFSNTFALSATA